MFKKPGQLACKFLIWVMVRNLFWGELTREGDVLKV